MAPRRPAPALSHVRLERGRRSLEEGAAARMVDVGVKAVTRREARARAQIRFSRGVLGPLLARGGPKGPILEVARTAGVMAAKRAWEWIPLCHPLALDHVEVDFRRAAVDVLEITCRTACSARTGVEMEALTGACAAALTVYDMTKAVDRRARLERVELLEKSGGRSGRWVRGAERR